MTDSGVATAEYTIQAAAPTFAPGEGSYTSVTSVTISSSTAGAVIRYTADASDPRSSPTAQTYAAPVSLSTTTVLKAYASKAGMADSNVSSAMYTITLPQVAAPVFDPNGGIFTSPQTVTMSSAAGATIKYTTDGSDPRTNTGASTYTAPLTISTSTVLKAHASKSGMRDSDMAVASFTINLPGYVATPVISPATNVFMTAQTVSITCATAGATIHYTTDGSVPTGSSTVYTGEFQVSTTTTIKVYAGNSVDIDSGIASATLTFLFANPTFNPPSGAFTTIQSMAISSATPGAEIRYTTDNNDPRSSATAVPYSVPVQVTSSTVLQAYAGMSSMTDSATVSAAYIVNLPSLTAPVMDPPAGIYTSARSISLSTVPTGATILYTVDGTDPKTSGTTLTYLSPIAVPATMTIKAYASKYNYLDSPVAEGTYTITGTVAAPTFNPAGGSYPEAKSIAISTTTPAAFIRYTTNGAVPASTVGTVYWSPVEIAATTTLKAVACMDDWADSPVTSDTYTMIAPPTPAGLTVGSATSSSLAVAWTPSEGATNYQVYRDTLEGGGYGMLAYTGIATGFTDGGRSAGTTYYYKVQATGAFGTSALSAAVSGTTTTASYWAKTYGGTGNDLANSIYACADGGSIVAGYSSSYGAGGYDWLLLRLIAAGNISWQKAYGGTITRVLGRWVHCRRLHNVFWRNSFMLGIEAHGNRRHIMAKNVRGGRRWRDCDPGMLGWRVYHRWIHLILRSRKQ